MLEAGDTAAPPGSANMTAGHHRQTVALTPGIDRTAAAATLYRLLPALVRQNRAWCSGTHEVVFQAAQDRNRWQEHTCDGLRGSPNQFVAVVLVRELLPQRNAC